MYYVYAMWQIGLLSKMSEELLVTLKLRLQIVFSFFFSFFSNMVSGRLFTKVMQKIMTLQVVHYIVLVQ